MREMDDLRAEMRCGQCGAPAGVDALRGGVCPACLLGQAVERPADVNWVRDRFPQMADVVPVGDGEPGLEFHDGTAQGAVRCFEARDFESGAAVLLSLWRLEEGAAARQLADLERRANLAHLGIARVVDFGEVDDWLYAIEERPAGQRLREAISVAEVSRGDMLRLVPEISAAVRYAAEQGVSIGAEAGTVFVESGGRVVVSGIGSTAGEAAQAVAWAEYHPAVGRRVGRYELLELIGEGGFAEVYRALEERPVRREVALKILKPGMDTRQILARFARERQALAMMSHRGIATIFDAGATESGRPWIAMELVAGKPLTAYCDERRLPLRERAALLAAVCHAVHHGHEKGVVHRDLKPSNILVAEQDGAPVAKVIDFGIATAAAEPAGGGAFFTRTHQFLGSPCYMSPEQVNGAEVDGRSDVYSLGAVLYQLLTGETPLTEEAVKDRGIREVIECVQREPAEHPADRVAGFPEARRASVARASSPGVEEPGLEARTTAELLTSLSGELSGIALKALHKNPAERYATAAALAEDLENWVSGQPVNAPLPRRRAARRVISALRWAAVLAVAAGGVAVLWKPSPENPVLPAPPGESLPAWAVRHPVRSRAADGSITPVALWQFDGDLRSSIAGGPDLEAIGSPALAFTSVRFPDSEARVMNAPRFLPSQWLKSPNVIGINGPPDATESNEWTLVFDVMFPSLTGPVALFQCDSENRAVAEVYAGPGGLGDTDYGIQFGQFREGEWYRIAVVSSISDRSQLYATWVNGARWGVPHVRGMNSAQFAFDDALVFFGEGNQRTGAFAVNSLAVYDVALADHEIRALGAVSAAGVPTQLQPGPARDVPGLLRAEQRMTPGDVRGGDAFGFRAAVSGDEAWISSPGSDGGMESAGAVLRWRRDAAGAWTAASRLNIPQPLRSAQLGTSLTLSPLAGVAGAPGANAAWLFTRSDAAAEWTVLALEGGAAPGSHFGETVALLDLETAAVSAPGHNTRGSVFLFTVTGGELRATLSPENARGFGLALAAAQGRLAVSDAAGQVFTFVRDAGGGWSHQATLSDPAAMPGFGKALAISANGEWLAIGAPAAKDKPDGAVFLYQFHDAAWSRSIILRAPDDGAQATQFAAALAFSGADRLLIGAPDAVSEGRRSGGVHLMHLQPDGKWQRARLIAPEDGSQDGKFGASLAADAQQVWIGAPEDHTDHAKGGGVWRVPLPQFEAQQFATEPPDPSKGSSVAIHGTLAACGTPGRDSRTHGGTARVFTLADGQWRENPPVMPGATNVPEGSFRQVAWDGSDLWSPVGGKLHRFRRNLDGTWTPSEAPPWPCYQVTTAGSGWVLAAQDAGWLFAPAASPAESQLIRLPCDRFSAAAISGQTAIAALKDGAKSAAVLELSGDAWRQQTMLTAPDAALWFARSIALHGDCALIGAPASDRTGSGTGDGRAYLFRRMAAGWKLEQSLETPAAEQRSAFGRAVAVHGDTALVASPRVAQGLSYGVVEVFRRNAAGRWQHDHTLEASHAEPGDGFGAHIAIDGAWAVIGAKAPRVYFFYLEAPASGVK